MTTPSRSPSPQPLFAPDSGVASPSRGAATTLPDSTQQAAEALDVTRTAQRWLKDEPAVALATVISTWGSAPVPTGGQMVVTADGRFQGSVSGGCIEGDVIAQAEDIVERGGVHAFNYGVEDETAWRVGLPCGGQLKVLVERLQARSDEDRALLDAALLPRDRRVGVAVRTHLRSGERTLFIDDGASVLPADIERALVGGKSHLVDADTDEATFIHALVPVPRVIIVGATHIAQVLSAMLKLIGYAVELVDPRTAFATDLRFPDVNLNTQWPVDAIPAIGLDRYTGVVTLAHEGRIDDEALRLALAGPCFYVGALGSKRNHAKRIERLSAAGVSMDEIGRISAPVGLDIGAQSPPEIAVSILADIVKAARQGTGTQPA
ncbi:MAG: XdhC family protein [Pseudomonadota bacterium]